MADTISLSDYGVALRETTLGLRTLLADALPTVTISVGHPASVSSKSVGTIVNIFLFGDELTTLRDGAQSEWNRTVVGADAHYLVSIHPGGDADESAESAVAFGVAQAIVEQTERLHIRLGVGVANDVTIWTNGFTIADRSAVWQAAGVPLRLSFGVRIQFALDNGPSRMNWLTSVVDETAAGRVLVFTGPDAEAKRDAAKSIADKLGRPLVMVALDRIVSKYIGETEENLRKVFDSAERGGAVLFFDEADALFGKRVEVEDAHDRYAGDFGNLLPLAEQGNHVVVIALTGEPSEGVAGQATLVPFPPD